MHKRKNAYIHWFFLKIQMRKVAEISVFRANMHETHLRHNTKHMIYCICQKTGCPLKGLF